MMQGDHNSDENICAYANLLRRNRREAVWDEEQHNIILHDLIWAGVKLVLAPGPGNTAAVWVSTGITVRFGSGPV